MSPIEKNIKEKIEKVGTPLKDWDVNIFRGILTGCNEAFIIDEAKRQELLAQDPRSAEIIRPILRGRDIKRYAYNWAELYILFVPWHFPLHNDNSIVGASEIAEQQFQKQYPAIYRHLWTFKKELSARNKAEVNVRYEWYALQRWGANYWEDFSKQKIVWCEISDNANFALDVNDNYCVNNKCYLMTGTRLKYLTCYLNSSLSEYLFSKIATTTGVGTLQWSKFTIEQLPVPVVSEEQERVFDRLLAGKVDKETVNRAIYDICKLTRDEIAFINEYVQ